jgi:hypothetical protein
MGVEDDRVEVSTAVAVRGDVGFFFGTLKWIEARRLLVEVDAELDPGDEIDVRITLAPTTGTSLLNAIVTRPLVTAKDEIARYLLEIVRIAPDQRALLDDWKLNVKNRGTFSRFDTVVSSQRSNPPVASQSNAEVRMALERMARRGTPSAGPATDPFGVRSDLVTGATRGAGRGAMRDALHGAIARGAAGRPAAGSQPPPHSVPPRSVPPISSDGPGRVVASGGTNPGFWIPSPQPVRDPSIATTQTRTAHWMQVTWHAPAAFERDARLQLCNYILVLQAGGAEPLPSQEPLRVMLHHGDLQLECAATIKAHGPQSATYRLMLDPLQIERLRQWSLDYLPRSR